MLYVPRFVVLNVAGHLDLPPGDFRLGLKDTLVLTHRFHHWCESETVEKVLTVRVEGFK